MKVAAVMMNTNLEKEENMAAAKGKEVRVSTVKLDQEVEMIERTKIDVVRREAMINLGGVTIVRKEKMISAVMADIRKLIAAGKIEPLLGVDVATTTQ